jgi:hypothetical protein
LTDLDARARNLRAALAFLRLPPTEPELRLLHRCFDNWHELWHTTSEPARAAVNGVYPEPRAALRRAPRQGADRFAEHHRVHWLEQMCVETGLADLLRGHHQRRHSQGRDVIQQP